MKKKMNRRKLNKEKKVAQATRTIRNEMRFGGSEIYYRQENINFQNRLRQKPYYRWQFCNPLTLHTRLHLPKNGNNLLTIFKVASETSMPTDSECESEKKRIWNVYNTTHTCSVTTVCTTTSQSKDEKCQR